MKISSFSESVAEEGRGGGDFFFIQNKGSGGGERNCIAACAQLTISLHHPFTPSFTLDTPTFTLDIWKLGGWGGGGSSHMQRQGMLFGKFQLTPKGD